MSKKVAVIGAGPMGLMTALRLLQQGYQVTLFERDDRIGGMTASFDFSGLTIERFYHFVCAPDQPTFDLLKELGIESKLKWKDTKMGFYFNGKLYPWGDPFSLLRFPKLNLWQKFRYGLFVLRAKNVKNWESYDKIYAKDWLIKNLGRKVYNMLWKPLFALKFDQYQDELSAAWLGTRIKRVGSSRRSLMQESLGYIEGGSATLLDRMESEITKLGGDIRLSTPVEKIVVEKNRVIGINITGRLQRFDSVVSTVPLPYVPNLMPDLPKETKEAIKEIPNVGVVCVLFKLKHQFSPNFWMNITDESIEIPGLIEYTNLQEYKDHVVYAPYYMSHQHAKFHWEDQQFIDEVTGYFQKINPEFTKDWIIDSHVARYGFSQTVCRPNFYQQLPPMRSSIHGFYMADTAYYYPEDRSIAESVRVGEKLAGLVLKDLMFVPPLDAETEVEMV